MVQMSTARPHTHGRRDGHVHAPAHSHSHGHSHAPANVTGRTMGTALGLTVAFVVGEAIFGWWGHSLALLSDAGHNFADAAALAFSWYALSVAAKPSNHGMTYGYHRVGILAALANAVSLVLIAIVIAWEAMGRMRHPEPADGGLMIVVALAAIGVNGLISFWLHKGSKDDVNVRSASVRQRKGEPRWCRRSNPSRSPCRSKRPGVIRKMVRAIRGKRRCCLESGPQPRGLRRRMCSTPACGL